MFADKTLTPREAVRLCALGTIAAAPMRYSELASSVRHFISRLAGPSVDLLGTSIELLRYEGLVDAIGGEGMEDDAQLAITEAGRREFRNLMVAPLRPASDPVQAHHSAEVPLSAPAGQGRPEGAGRFASGHLGNGSQPPHRPAGLIGERGRIPCRLAG